jgi:peptidyl-prolyl cis-trans isomerase C
MPTRKLFIAILVIITFVFVTSLVTAQNESAPESEQAPAAQTAPAEVPDPVAVVNEVPIPKDLYQVYAQQRQAQLGNVNSPQARETLINELVIQELLVQQANDMNLSENEQIATQLKIMERNLLAEAAVRKMLEEQGPSASDVETAYETNKNTMDKEYKASHILVESEEKAQELINELEEGAEFAELAKSNSSDSSAAQGGSLGWFTTNMMVPAFSESVSELEKGNYTETPVQTQFGWHVIKLDDVRDTEPPTLESMRPEIMQRLQGQAINDYLVKLRSDADIEIK